jgi:formylglycine-generating enzyme required for sulfatase activity
VSTALAIVVAVASTLACSLRDVSDLDRETQAVTDGGPPAPDGGAACAVTCGDPACPCPSVAQIAVTSPAGAYRIDSLEVTTADYRRWLATHPSMSGQRAECAWNTSYEPGVISPSASQAVPDQATPASAACAQLCGEGDALPIVCVDWCDAVAYCAWAKKHLCGRIGAPADSRTIEISTSGVGPFADTSVSEWHRACAGPNGSLYPYGASYAQGRCNDSQFCYEQGATFPGCISTIGAFDLSGNVSEWEDACAKTTDPNAEVVQPCLRRGGAFWQDQAALACNGLDLATRSIPSRATGFRCCADPG